ncbi:MAG: 16S rRNA (cytosine(967)-C(5))-methyltransferase RsmB [Gammaproteobacteria bacterium]|nr:16S rRNA (cytosine(967)-C(5))-methyltransferase RsmB [Gammaproteobacteria bacterium]
MRARPEPGAAVRAAAAWALCAVFAGRSLDPALEAVEAHLGAADRALLRAIAYGVLRQRRRLEALRERLLSSTRRPRAEIQALLLVGLYQLTAMRVPPHAAVAATVAAAQALGQPAARGLVNAVMRRTLREQRTLEAGLPQRPEILHSYPDWLAAALARDWPRHWPQVLADGNQPGPLVLRVNRRRLTREDYLDQLLQHGFTARPVAAAADAVRLATPLPVERIPGFAEGRVSVQDAGAQLGAPLLDARPGQRVLDACTAPGGKAAHLLERIDDLHLLALDVDAQRQRRTAATLERLGLRARLAVGDATRPSAWWDGRPFDRILVDAPCSGSGVIRRHPDIKWLRCEGDVAALALRQRALLQALWPLLAPGGILVYAVCSILNAEGAAVAGAFLGEHADAIELPVRGDWGEACSVGRRLAPGGDFDGFYYARLKKTGGA